MQRVQIARATKVVVEHVSRLVAMPQGMADPRHRMPSGLNAGGGKSLRKHLFDAQQEGHLRAGEPAAYQLKAFHRVQNAVLGVWQRHDLHGGVEVALVPFPQLRVDERRDPSPPPARLGQPIDALQHDIGIAIQRLNDEIHHGLG